MEGAAEGDSGSRLNEIQRSKLGASEHGKQRLHQEDVDSGRRAQWKPDNFIETVKLLWGLGVINLISLHYPNLYCLVV